jgi:uncharacterized protein involved in exopolysaccharide biosynthesis
LSAAQPLLTDEDDAIDLGAVVRLLWRYRRSVAVTSLSFGLIALVIALQMEPYFRAEAVLTSVRERGIGNGSGSLGNELGGLASFAGLNLLGTGTPDQDAMAVLDSHHLAELFIERYGLLPVLLRKSKKPPSMWRAVKAFKEGVLTVQKDVRKGVTTIAVVWKDPREAARWANEFAALANEVIRKRTVDETGRNIAYLNEQISKTNDVDLRRVLYNILEGETKTLMLANARAEYAFQVVDPAVPPELKAGPHRSWVVLGGLMLGFLVAGGVAFAHDRTKRYRRARGEQGSPAGHTQHAGA